MDSECPALTIQNDHQLSVAELEQKYQTSATKVSWGQREEWVQRTGKVEKEREREKKGKNALVRKGERERERGDKTSRDRERGREMGKKEKQEQRQQEDRDRKRSEGRDTKSYMKGGRGKEQRQRWGKK